MRYVLLGAVVLWIASMFYFLLTWDWSPDRFIEWATAVITLGGFVLGLLGVIVVIVSGIWSGHQEKKQWE
jgi:multisubunit Na+/H+ antiporter MnhB subunit